MARHDWEARTQYIRDRLDIAAIEQMRRRIAAVFRPEANKTHRRKPSLGVRLYSGNMNTMIAVAPQYERSQQIILPDTLCVETYCQLSGDTHTVPTYRVHFAIRMVWTDSECRIQKYRRNVVAAAAGDVSEIARAFIQDPAAAIARCKNRCCMCGRVLTDGTSRSRGFGPECAKQLGNAILLEPMFT